MNKSYQLIIILVVVITISSVFFSFRETFASLYHNFCLTLNPVGQASESAGMQYWKNREKNMVLEVINGTRAVPPAKPYDEAEGISRTREIEPDEKDVSYYVDPEKFCIYNPTSRKCPNNWIDKAIYTFPCKGKAVFLKSLPKNIEVEPHVKTLPWNQVSLNDGGVIDNALLQECR